MASNIVPVKAVRATIKLGDIDLDCYQMPDGSYWFSQNQLEISLDIRTRNQTGKTHLKPLLEASPSHRNQIKIVGNNATAKVLHIDLVTQAIGIYAGLGNQKCMAIAIACMAEALERRADSVFGKIRTEQERNERLKARVQHKTQFHPLYTQWLKQDGISEGWQYAAKVNELKQRSGLPLVPIGEFDSMQMQRFNSAEIIYDAIRRSGMSHESALKMV